jgi:hypothetical protein
MNDQQDWTWEERDDLARQAALEREAGIADVSRCTVCGTVGVRDTPCLQCFEGRHPLWKDEEWKP